MLSCSDDSLIDVEQSQQLYDGVRSALTRSAVSEDDFIHFIQTDKMSMLLNRVVKTDSTYVLDLSREQAKILEIPDSLYDLAIDVVYQFNHPSER